MISAWWLIPAGVLCFAAFGAGVLVGLSARIDNSDWEGR